jgi:hypothetical protein
MTRPDTATCAVLGGQTPRGSDSTRVGRAVPPGRSRRRIEGHVRCSARLLHRTRWLLVVRVGLGNRAFRLPRCRCPLHEPTQRGGRLGTNLWCQEHHQRSTADEGAQDGKSAPGRCTREARATKRHLRRRFGRGCQHGTKDTFCFDDERIHGDLLSRPRPRSARARATRRHCWVHHACHRARSRSPPNRVANSAGRSVGVETTSDDLCSEAIRTVGRPTVRPLGQKRRTAAIPRS